MKKYLIIILTSLLFGFSGYCQEAASIFKPDRRLKPSDSINYRAKIQYFAPIPKGKGNCILSVDQNSVRFLYDSPYGGAKDCYLQLQVKLANRSADTLEYQSMSCSWWDIYRTDNKNMKIFAPETCFKNSFVTRILMPYQEIITTIVVVFAKKQAKIESFKIGMTFQRGADFKYRKNVVTGQITTSDLRLDNIIWSNYIIVPAVIGH